MDTFSSNTKKLAEDIHSMDCLSTTSSSLQTEFSHGEFNCICSQLPKANESSQCVVTIESGIGSSVSSIDAHPGMTLSNTCKPVDSDVLGNIATASNVSHSRYDCHELPPVSEEDDHSDGIISIIHSNKEENAHLDVLPWHDTSNSACNLCHRRSADVVNNDVPKFDGINLCKKWCDHQKQVHDDLCVLIHDDAHCHLPKPWQRDEVIASMKPILSPMCHEENNVLVRSEVCFSNNSQSKSIFSSRNCCQNMFTRRHSIQNSSSILYHYRTNMCWESRANIFENDNDESQILSRAAERVVEWLKLMSIDSQYSENNNSSAQTRTFLFDKEPFPDNFE